MTRGIECAFWGVLGKDPVLQTSKNGNPYSGLNVVVVTGQSSDGKDVTQWLRVTCFGDAAKALSASAKKGDRVYIEGTLTMTQWSSATGEMRHGLNVAAWKAQRVASIGTHRAKKEWAKNGE